MLSHESSSHPQSREAPDTDQQEVSVHPQTSPNMEKAVTKLATKHGVDLAQRGTLFSVDQSNHSQRWLIGNTNGRIGVTRCQVDQDNLIAPDLDIVFDVKPEGWEPVEIVHTPGVWQDYANAAQGRPLIDAHGDFNLAEFADHWAQQMEEAQPEKQRVEEQKTGPTLAQDEIIFLYEQELHDT